MIVVIIFMFNIVLTLSVFANVQKRKTNLSVFLHLKSVLLGVSVKVSHRPSAVL